MVQDDLTPVTDPINTQVVFLSLGRDASFELNFFRTDANVERGQFLGAHIGTSDDANLLSVLLNKFRKDFSSSLDYESVVQAQAEAAERCSAPPALALPAPGAKERLTTRRKIARNYWLF